MPRKIVAPASATPQRNHHTTSSSSNHNNNDNASNKRIQSYNRLLNAGFIKKEVFDNSMQRLSNTKPSSTTIKGSAPSPQSSSNNHNQSYAQPGSRAAPAPPHLNHNSQNSVKSQNPLPPPHNNPTSALAKHVLSSVPISNFSGQYPTNGTPGSIRH